MAEEPDLARIAGVLARHDVDYVLIGGRAVVLHGGDTVTHDIDLAFDLSDQNFERLADALQELGAKPTRWQVTNYRLAKSDLASLWLHLESAAGDIDLIKTTPSLDYKSLKQNRKEMSYENVTIFVASIEDLLKIKRSAGRDKDAQHVKELEILQEP